MERPAIIHIFLQSGLRHAKCAPRRCSVLIFLLLLEIALRAIDHPRREARILCFDAIMDNVYCPNIEERLNNMSQSTLLVKINSEGMADREYSLIKPDSAIRVWLLPACLSTGEAFLGKGGDNASVPGEGRRGVVFHG